MVFDIMSPNSKSITPLPFKSNAKTVEPECSLGVEPVGISTTETHTVDKIVAFLRDNRFIMSLRPKWVHEKIDQYNYLPKTKPVGSDLSYEFTQSETFSTNNKKKSIISKLKELE